VSSRRRLIVPVLALAVAGCGGVITRTSEGLTRGILSHDDPQTVKAGMPAFLLVMDGLIEADPEDADRLAGGATLYTAYAATFVDDAARRKRLAARALGYAERSACAEAEALCGLRTASFEQATATVAAFGEEPADAKPLFTLAQSWLGWIKANSDDLAAIAELPRAQAALERVLALDPDNADAHLYMGILFTALPEALGGKPEEGRRRFERAIELGQGADLAAKVQFAESYARLVFDRELHDRLLNEVVAAPAEAPGRTLQNVLAKERAQALLASATEYF
jgi:tetratricopeptide (TPR) repeat protein